MLALLRQPLKGTGIVKVWMTKTGRESALSQPNGTHEHSEHPWPGFHKAHCPHMGRCEPKQSVLVQSQLEESTREAMLSAFNT